MLPNNSVNNSTCCPNSSTWWQRKFPIAFMLKKNQTKRKCGRPRGTLGRSLSWTTSSSLRAERSWRSAWTTCRTSTSGCSCTAVHGSTDTYTVLPSSTTWEVQLQTRRMVPLDQAFRTISESGWTRPKGRREPREYLFDGRRSWRHRNVIRTDS